MNHPKHHFDAEEAERKEKAKGTPIKFFKHEDAPQTKSEQGKLKTESVEVVTESVEDDMAAYTSAIKKLTKKP